MDSVLISNFTLAFIISSILFIGVFAYFSLFHKKDNWITTQRLSLGVFIGAIFVSAVIAVIYTLFRDAPTILSDLFTSGSYLQIGIALFITICFLIIGLFELTLFLEFIGSVVFFLFDIVTGKVFNRRYWKVTMSEYRDPTELLIVGTLVSATIAIVALAFLYIHNLSIV